MSEQVQPSGGEVSFARLIGTSIATKLLVDSTTQIFNPFLHIIATGLGTDVVTLGRLLGLRSAVGMLAPFFGALSRPARLPIGDPHGFAAKCGRHVVGGPQHEFMDDGARLNSGRVGCLQLYSYAASVCQRTAALCTTGQSAGHGRIFVGLNRHRRPFCDWLVDGDHGLAHTFFHSERGSRRDVVRLCCLTECAQPGKR